MDTCKIGSNLYQYTAIDDCTRYRVLRLYDRRTAANTLDFLEAVLEEMPFPIQRIQTDRGRKFFALKIQKRPAEVGVKFRPNKPGSPHLNGKVERSQQINSNFMQLFILSLRSFITSWQSGNTTTTGTDHTTPMGATAPWSAFLN